MRANLHVKFVSCRSKRHREFNVETAWNAQESPCGRTGKISQMCTRAPRKIMRTYKFTFWRSLSFSTALSLLALAHVPNMPFVGLYVCGNAPQARTIRMVTWRTGAPVRSMRSKSRDKRNGESEMQASLWQLNGKLSANSVQDTTAIYAETVHLKRCCKHSIYTHATYAPEKWENVQGLCRFKIPLHVLYKKFS